MSRYAIPQAGHQRPELKSGDSRNLEKNAEGDEKSHDLQHVRHYRQYIKKPVHPVSFLP